MKHGFRKIPAIVSAFAAAVLAVVLPGCPADQSDRSSWKREGTERITIVCTTGMVADMVRNVGKEHVKVSQLMAAEIDPHLYRASTGDASALKNADMIFYSGLHLEANLVSTFESLSRKKPVFAVADEVYRWRHGDLLVDKSSYDPHIWFDVSLWKDTLKLIADRLADYDPKNARSYAENARKYAKRLEALHEFCKSELSKIPANRRVLVTAHDAFSYFGKAYGIEVRAIQGKSTASRAGVRHIEELITFIVQKKIKAVFVESSVPDSTIEQLIQGCRAKGHTVKLGGRLFSDAMGKSGTKEENYEGMVRYNVNTIVKALK